MENARTLWIGHQVFPDEPADSVLARLAVMAVPLFYLAVALIYSAYLAPWGRQVDPESAYAMNGLVGWSASERRECDMLVGIRREFGLGPLRRMIKHILRKICGEYDDLSPDMGTHSLPRVKPKHPAGRPDINCCEAASTNRRVQDTNAQSFLCPFRRFPERASRDRSPILLHRLRNADHDLAGR